MKLPIVIIVCMFALAFFGCASPDLRQENTELKIKMAKVEGALSSIQRVHEMEVELAMWQVFDAAVKALSREVQQ
jgi:hypothetical protein